MTHFSLRNRSLLVLVIVAVLALQGCRQPSRQGAARDNDGGSKIDPRINQQVQQEPRSLPSVKSPFEHYFYTQTDVGLVAEVADCAVLSLSVNDVVVGETLEMWVAIENNCEEPVAVLTGPLEVRIRLDKEDVFPAELLTSAVYGVLHVADAKAGLGSDAFHGDGGLEVFGPPAFFWVLPHSSSEIPVEGADISLRTLPAGEYLASILTPVVFAENSAKMTRPFELSDSVEAHNERAKDSARAVRIPPTAARISAVATFTVTAP